MKFKKPKNSNYCATIVKIKNVIPLENCDNIQGTIIFGNHIIIGKDTKVNDVGVYFPAECQLSYAYASKNNLYRHPELNENKEVKGYIEDNRRIRAMKMRGHESAGLYMPLSSLSHFCGMDEFKVGDEFDEIDGIEICNKYIVQQKQKGGLGKGKKKSVKISKAIPGQFRFHEDTQQFAKNIHRFTPNDLVSITYKLHGTSVIISKVLCKKPLNPFYKILKWGGIPIIDTQYDNLYSSRKVLKNDALYLKNKNVTKSFYDMDIWGLANERLKEYLVDGLTIYAEVVGYLPTGAYIQKPFDYGCSEKAFDVYIYRITYTNSSGNVFEFSAKQVQDWSKERGLNPVYQLFYGDINNIFEWEYGAYSKYYNADIFSTPLSDLDFQNNFLNTLKEKYLEQDCFMCKNKVPAEGIVVRKETNRFEAYKLKSFRFLELETKMLDNNTEDIEENQ